MRTCFLLSIVMIFSVKTMYGQIADPMSAEKTLPGTITVLPGEQSPGRAVSSPNAVDARTISLYYHDSSLARLLWRVPANYGQFTTLNIGQRFDLPAERGLLDSIHVFVRELPLGRMRFDVWRDTLRRRITADARLYHYPNYWVGRSAVTDSAFLFAGLQDTASMVTVVFRSLPVARIFHVVAEPYTDTAFTSLFGIYTDTQLGVLDDISPEKARSHMMWNIGGTIVPVHMHGRFVDPDDTTRFFSPALYMKAFVTLDGTSGSETIALPAGVRIGQPYPNPASSLLTLPFELSSHGHLHLEIFDASGRSKAVAVDAELGPGRHQRTFDVGRFTPGIYHVRLTAAGVDMTRSFVISR